MLQNANFSQTFLSLSYKKIVFYNKQRVWRGFLGVDWRGFLWGLGANDADDADFFDTEFFRHGLRGLTRIFLFGRGFLWGLGADVADDAD